MKKKLLGLLSISALLLSACSFLNNDVGFKYKTMKLYSFVDMDIDEHADPVKAQEKAYKGDFTLRIHPAYKNILYTDFKSYCKMLATNLPETFTYEVTESEFAVSNQEGNSIFVAEVETGHKRIGYAGSLPLGSLGGESMPAGTLMTDAKIEQKNVVPAKSPINYVSYERFEKDLPTYTYGYRFIAPLGMFDTVFGSVVNAYHIYDFKQLVQYNSSFPSDIAIGEADNTVKKNLEKFYQDNGMPIDMRLLEKASLYLTLDNFYGLRDHRHIPSMSNYLDSLGFGKSLLVDDAEERCYNFFDLFAALDDDHSGVGSIAPWFGDVTEASHRSQRSGDRKRINESLLAQRAEELNTQSSKYGFDDKVHYSTSGKTAFFYFDSFRFDQREYSEDIKDELWLTDSFFYFIHQFEAIVAHGGVERVVIDDSCNGGGTIGIALKLLTLISKDNSGDTYFYNVGNESVLQLSCQLDINGDGLYDKKDVYGDDFEISILTSPASFSCGNLFPIVAQRYGNAKVIGKTSGGGECSVTGAFLPSGRFIQFSSNSALCDYQFGKTVRNFELGATPDIDIPYYQFYNIDYLESVLQK